MLLFNVIVTEPLFVNEPQNPFLITVSVNMSLKMYSFYGKVKFLWELSTSQSQPHALGVIAVLKKRKKRASKIASSFVVLKFFGSADLYCAPITPLLLGHALYMTLPCTLCATKFSKTLNLNIQVRALHNIITEMCMFCQKHFLQPSQIIDHFESFSSSMQWL